MTFTLKILDLENCEKSQLQDGKYGTVIIHDATPSETKSTADEAILLLLHPKKPSMHM